MAEQGATQGRNWGWAKLIGWFSSKRYKDMGQFRGNNCIFRGKKSNIGIESSDIEGESEHFAT